jgi:cytochrome bd-type quinol oxidase subunit 2
MSMSMFKLFLFLSGIFVVGGLFSFGWSTSLSKDQEKKKQYIAFLIPVWHT